MSIHNYLRPLWSNGPHVVHDAPPTVRTAFELLFRGKPRRQGESIVQLHRVRPLDVTVAWLEVEVAMPVEGTGLSYRRARYLHAFAADGPGPDVLTARRARALFEDVYGEDLVAGVHAAQRSLIGLEHPARARIGRGCCSSVSADNRSRHAHRATSRRPRSKRAKGSVTSTRWSHRIRRDRIEQARRRRSAHRAEARSPTMPGCRHLPRRSSATPIWKLRSSRLDRHPTGVRQSRRSIGPSRHGPRPVKPVAPPTRPASPCLSIDTSTSRHRPPRRRIRPANPPRSVRCCEPGSCSDPPRRIRSGRPPRPGTRRPCSGLRSPLAAGRELSHTLCGIRCAASPSGRRGSEQGAARSCRRWLSVGARSSAHSKHDSAVRRISGCVLRVGSTRWGATQTTTTASC